MRYQIWVLAVVFVLVAAAVVCAETIESGWMTSTPTIDGAISAGEWDDATQTNLSAAGTCNLYLKNDGQYLYGALDAVDDTVL